MNYIDLFLFAIIILSIWNGIQHGFIVGVVELVSWMASLVIGFLYYPKIAGWLEKHFTSLGILAVPIAFIAAVVLARIIFAIVAARILTAIPRQAHGHVANRVLGIVPGTLNGLIWAAILSTLLLIIPLWKGTMEETRESRIANTLSVEVERLQQKISPLVDDVVKRSLNKLVINPRDDSSVSLPYRVQNAQVRSDLETEMLKLVNEERAKAGLKPVVEDLELAYVARQHSKDMFARGYFSHVNPEGQDPFHRIKAAKIGFVTAGENLALAQTLKMAHYGLMHSPGHRANILNPAYGRVGIGIQDGGIYGLMITQNFRN
jgi:uncharacterized protein YkwD